MGLHHWCCSPKLTNQNNEHCHHHLWLCGACVRVFESSGLCKRLSERVNRLYEYRKQQWNLGPQTGLAGSCPMRNALTVGEQISWLICHQRTLYLCDTVWCPQQHISVVTNSVNARALKSVKQLVCVPACVRVWLCGEREWGVPLQPLVKAHAHLPDSDQTNNK